MQAKWAVPLKRGNPPSMSFKEIALAAGLSVPKLRPLAASDPDFPRPWSDQKTAYSNTYYSKPDALKWVKKYLTSRA